MQCSLSRFLTPCCGFLFLGFCGIIASEVEAPAAERPSEVGQTGPKVSLVAGTVSLVAGTAQPASSGTAQPVSSGTAQPASVQPPPRFRQPEPWGPWEERAVHEILEIRRAQGDLFQGTVFGEMASSQGEGEFLRALRNVVQQQPRLPSGAPLSDQLPSWESSPALEVQREPLAFGGASRTLVRSLRRTCRHLDRTANALEATQQYDESDRLRGLSEQLRMEARRWAAFSGATDARPDDHPPSVRVGQ